MDIIKDKTARREIKQANERQTSTTLYQERLNHSQNERLSELERTVHELTERVKALAGELGVFFREEPSRLRCEKIPRCPDKGKRVR